MPFTAEDCRRCREDFPALRRTLPRTRDGDGEPLPLAYLDGPAGTQVPERVIDAVADVYRNANANTHGRFPTSRDTDRMIRRAREAVAAYLGAADWRSISFGANMTTLTFSLAHALVRTWTPGDEVVITQLDHEANRGPWLTLRERGIEVREVAITPGGELDLEDLERQVGERTRLVAVGWASNALGTVNDLGRIAEIARAAGARLLVDAVHYAAHFAVDVGAPGLGGGPDFLLCSAYKFYGPHVGILYARPGLLEELPTDKLVPQEDAAPYRIETGTLNHAAIAGVTAAIEYLAGWGTGEDLRARIVSAMDGIAAWEHGLAGAYHERVSELPGVRIWGPGFSSGRRAPTVSITVEGRTPEELAGELGERGIQVWDGDFYAVRAIEVLGLAEQGGVLRTGVSMYNTPGEIDRLVAALSELVPAGVAG